MNHKVSLFFCYILNILGCIMKEHMKCTISDDLELQVSLYGSFSKTSFDKCPVVILHGFLDHHLSWEYIALSIQQVGNISVVSYDQRGHGRSSHVSTSSQYHFPDYISDLYQLLESLQISKCHLVGHSMGGTVASIFAAAFPEKVVQLFLIEGLGPSHENEILSFQRIKKHLHQRTRHVRHAIYPHFQDLCTRIQNVYPFLRTETVEKFAIYLGVEVNHENQTGWTWRYDVRHKDANAISFHEPRHLELLTHIKSPTFLCFGRNSWYLTIPNVQNRIQKLQSCVDIQYLDCGHNPHIECPQELSDWIIKHLTN